jgi:hypothetical protein
MNWKYILIGIVVTIFILIVGCSMMMDMYPAKVTKDLARYTNHDPNHLNWPTGTMGTLREWLAEASLKHQLTKAELDYWAQRDNITYTAISTSGASYLATAQSEVNSAFGPNGFIWPLVTLFAGTGVGGVITATVVNKYKNDTMYSEQEHQDALTKATNATPTA